MPRELWFTNSQTGKKEKFTPRNSANVTMYSCGPTVYGFIHIGNLRAAMVADLIYRVIRHAGYGVTYVRNYTDIDDKILNRAREENTTFEAVAKTYTAEVEKDYAVAGLLEPTHKTKATDHVPEMLAMIGELVANGHAYVANDGEVLFSIESFPTYGRLSRKPLEDLQAGARVEVSAKKRSPLDFTLWKPAKPGEPAWKSPWADGRPGWHIECSAMARKWLGDQIDLHHGGMDLIFPHHENEVAQTEGVTHAPPFVQTWVHNNMLTIDREKMSKSVGNVWLARDFLTRFNGELARLLLLGSHYRSQVDISESVVDQSLKELERIYDAKKKALELSQKKMALGDPRAENLWGTFAMDCQVATEKIESAFANDLNTPEALSALFGLIREFNRVCQEPKAEATPAAGMAAMAFLKVLEGPIGEVLGIGLRMPEQMLSDLGRIRAERQKTSTGTALSPEAIEALLAERLAARAAKNFARADEIRKELAAKGVEIKDGPQGTTWAYK